MYQDDFFSAKCFYQIYNFCWNHLRPLRPIWIFQTSIAQKLSHISRKFLLCKVLWSNNIFVWPYELLIWPLRSNLSSEALRGNKTNFFSQDFGQINNLMSKLTNTSKVKFDFWLIISAPMNNCHYCFKVQCQSHIKVS